MKYYTYIHYRASDSKPFYVGKGSGGRVFCEKGRNDWWRNIVEKHGLTVEIIAKWDKEEDAFLHEMFLIKTLRELGYELCNMTEGGDGTRGKTISEETKKKMSMSHRGKKLTDEHKLKMSIARRGKPLSDETKRKMSKKKSKHKIKRIGKPRSEETKLKISLAHQTQDEETKRKIASKISMSNSGKPLSDETKRKMSIAKLGRAFSEEHKMKISMALKARTMKKGRSAMPLP